jgi:hypothetical protein
MHHERARLLGGTNPLTQTVTSRTRRPRRPPARCSGSVGRSSSLEPNSSRILERRLAGERPGHAAECAAAVRMEAQMLRYRAHDKLMKASLGPEVFEGTVTRSSAPAPASTQLWLA